MGLARVFFPFWNQKIQRLTDSLEDDGVIIVRKRLQSKKEYDQTKWYRIDYDKLMSLPDRNYFEKKKAARKKVKKLERINKKIKKR
ncbi:hypothetical protein GCM10020331_010780 [Ectobacillus funiculus]